MVGRSGSRRGRDGVAAALIIADLYRADLEVTFAPSGAAAAGEAAIERAERLFESCFG
jgi:hypothetical protein